MSELLNRVEKTILARGLFRQGQRILPAVSGGVDSMVLLNVLRGLSHKHGWRLAVAHFNHQLRGRSSDADERLVRREAEKLGLKFVADRGDVRELARVRKLSLEMAARKLRHDFLARAAKELKISHVALAHHADDQVELFFLRLLRGCGGEGLAGMKWSSTSPADPKIRLARPLLNQPKTALAAYAKERGIRFREDASNSLIDIPRNRIRRELLPRLTRDYQPALARIISRQMEIIGAEAELAGELARRWLKKRGKGAGFERLPVAVQRRGIQIQLIERGLPADFELIERLRELPDRRVTIGPKLTIHRNKNGRLCLEEVDPGNFGFDEKRLKVKLRGGAGEFNFDGLTVKWKVDSGRAGTFRAARKSRNSENNGNIELFDANKVGTQMVLRHWQPGDRFQPIGMKTRVKVQDLFTNQQIPRARR
ncbi:MAG TPA: tRNA lysidine(34) synthetase TilS, partial [Verrucomicrobiae bacterium]|nr:tRNA lysidine(34) synthetase TilS [Verrucomicrobiae bacterium]